MALELDIVDDTAHGDADALQHMFVNLLLNSFQAIEGSGVIKISASQDTSNDMKIVYEDNGPGIPAEQHERVFDPFFTTKQVGEGTGLGLFIVASIVEEHSGHIRIEDMADKGVRFVITLPIAQAEASHGLRVDNE
jgi:signal transduction histidine kinase